MTLPPWHEVIHPDSGAWRWQDGRLIHRGAEGQAIPAPPIGSLRRLIVNQVYATQNRSRNVGRALARVLNHLGENDWELNIGSGTTSLHTPDQSRPRRSAGGCQVRFQIGYHPGFGDFLRFSREALHFLFNSDRWQAEETEISLGYRTGFYRIEDRIPAGHYCIARKQYGA